MTLRGPLFPALCALALSAGWAFATEHEVKKFAFILDDCYAAAADDLGLTACRGLMSETCMTREEGGQTTLGMTSCLMAEAQAWDRHLNAEYKATMAWAEAADAEEAAAFPSLANRAEALRAAQRAWIAFRDAQCGLDYALWGSGSMRNIAGASCQADMTAERTIELFGMRRQFE